MSSRRLCSERDGETRNGQRITRDTSGSWRNGRGFNEGATQGQKESRRLGQSAPESSGRGAEKAEVREGMVLASLSHIRDGCARPTLQL